MCYSDSHITRDRRHVAMVHWALGFVEDECDTGSLLRHRFPSKVGGPPAWLNPVSLPTQKQLQCAVSGKLLQFLLQIYAAPQAGAPDDHPGAFHRAIFLFISPRGDSLHQAGAVRAFRCQLPRVNKYYSSEPSEEQLPPALPDHGPNSQVDPWSTALESNEAEEHGVVSPKMLKEMEIVVEPVDSDDDSLEIPDSMQSRIDEYNTRVQEEGEMSDSEANEVDALLTEKETEDDKFWKRFQIVASRDPECVLRYSRDQGAEPCWGRSRPLPEEIPPCPRCGAERHFEFQVMPQLLAFLGTDDMASNAPDWLTMAVYTCSASCVPEGGEVGENESPSYAEEFVFVQPPYSDP